MGLAATQARFLQLTARKSNIEYQAQQITFQRLQKTKELQEAANEYENKMFNRKLTFNFNTGSGVSKVDISYNNYKNYINQQMEGLSSTMDKYYLVSSSGKKIIVASEAEKEAMMKANPLIIDESDDESAGFQSMFSDSDFMIVEDLDDTEKFQQSIMDGVFCFARYVQNDDDEWEFKTESWDALGAGAIIEEYDTSDDAEAQAKFENIQRDIQSQDKSLEMELKKLESEREAVSTEIESVKKVLDESIKTFNMNS